MQTAVVKWGNSQGIRLPKTFLQNINISENETVDVILQNEAIIIRKINHKKHQTTKERLMAFYGEEYEQKTIVQNEVDWPSVHEWIDSGRFETDLKKSYGVMGSF